MTDGPGFFRNIWHAIGLLLWYFIFKVLNRVRVLGEENIPRRGESSSLILGNHVSAIDPFAIAATSMPFFSSVWWRAPAKAELFRIPVIKKILSSWGAIPVIRGQHDLESISRMVALLPSSVVVAFPEGRRSTDGQLLPGRLGMGKVIHNARPKKVIPVYIQGTAILLPKGKILPRIFKTVTLHYGKPLDLSRFYNLPDSLMTFQQIVDEVMREIAHLKQTLS
ncbi:MAG: 1-acyl-sn-glycerol-3-phosphate acyltransferase [Nitrospira sp.]|nr:1-acyl-sn-glycerol-3-phosphate acyltransferase [Nitrospira sp.]